MKDKLDCNLTNHQMTRFHYVFDDVCNFIIRLLSLIILWLAPISNYVNMVWILLAINFLTGLFKSINYDKQKFSTSKFQKSIVKFVLYAVAIIVAFILQKILNDGTEIAKIIAVAIGSGEAVSIYENISKLTGMDIISAAWKTIKEKLDDYITGLKISPPKEDDDVNN